MQLDCAVEINGKKFRAGEIVTMKQNKYSELASQGLVTKILTVFEGGYVEKQVEKSPENKIMNRKKTRLSRKNKK